MKKRVTVRPTRDGGSSTCSSSCSGGGSNGDRTCEVIVIRCGWES